MTWGVLRFQLAQALPGVSLDLLDEWLNCRYETVLESTDWTGRKAHAMVQTVAAHQSSTDTVTFTTGSAIVTGLGTGWTSAATVGLWIFRPGDSVIYQVVAWNSTTEIIIDRPYEGVGTEPTGTAYPASAYVIMQHIYPLPSDLGSIVECVSPTTQFPMAVFTKSEMDASAGCRTLVDDPDSYALCDDSSENAAPVLHQIEFYPPPRYARGIAIEYLRSANGFDGSNTGSGPLPFISNSVLLYGCRADGYAYLAGKTDAPGDKSTYLQLAKMHEAKFGEELARLLRVEHQQRRKMTPVKLASRFTRHRMARASRTMNSTWGRGAGGPL